MATTLFQLTYELARALRAIKEGKATGGSTTTLIDTVDRSEADDHWNGGTIWVLVDGGGAGAAPQNEFGVITDFDNASNTATIRDALTAAIAAGDFYAIATQRFPLHVLRQAINEVLTVIPKTDTSTVTIATDQLEYNLPTDCLDLRRVWIQTDSDVNDWKRLYDWDVEKTALNTADKLVLSRQFESGYSVKLEYIAYHPRLQDSDDVMDESYIKNMVIYNAAVSCLLYRKSQVGDSDLSVNDLLNYYQALASQANQQFPQSLPTRTAKTIHPVF